ncbi:MAG: HAMP domain-containing sensor histidine kinase [Pseudomonadota bacterium]
MTLQDSTRHFLKHFRPARMRVRAGRVARRLVHDMPSAVTRTGEQSKDGVTRREALQLGLPGKLLLLTLAFVMLAEILIFVPSIANFRVNWLQDRLVAARLASLAATAAEGGEVPSALRQDLLRSAGVQAIAVKQERVRRMILPADQPLVIDASFDLRQLPADSAFASIGKRLALIRDALYVFIAPNGRMIRAYGQTNPAERPDDVVEVVLDEDSLCKAMIDHALNILILSVIISLITATLVYIALSRVLVNPMLALSRNMVTFGENPEDHDRIIKPSGRGDEIGIAERELAQMQTQLNQALNQKNRLAQLGLAVSKINHDLRNMLASAQLLSDRLGMLPDPTVQRFAPKLVASLDRAINFCNDTLKFGRAEEAAPRRSVFPLIPLVREVADGLQLPRERVDWVIEIPEGLSIDADREHLFRILNNIMRNAVDALEQQPNDHGRITVSATRSGRETLVRVVDNGPGVPEKARKNLFKAFQGNVRPGGTGLGLAISAELVRAHGGRIELKNGHGGAVFEITVPDRSRAD